MSRTTRAALGLVAVLAMALAAGCSGTHPATLARNSTGPSGSAAPSGEPGSPASSGSGTPSGSPTPGGSPAPGTHRYTKVMIIAEDAHTYTDVLGPKSTAPYLRSLAAAYGNLTAMHSGYSRNCPSLPGYLLMTSGSSYSICDDKPPLVHPVDGDNIFAQVAAAGMEWRDYAEGAAKSCQETNGTGNLYVVKHVPAAYYTTEAVQCPFWVVPMGSPTGGSLHYDVAKGTLPAYAFVSPDACDDMQGAPGCRTGIEPAGDNWLKKWLPVILAGPDYRAGRLVVIVTWDEGSRTDDHIPTVVVSPTSLHLTTSEPYTHCSTLRTTEELLGLPFIGCAASASSYVSALHL